ncbi:GNAT family N-acetyltransferase [Dyadobacter sandarakinus]|uniref:GNAT family N-acetyltransferase n=1 Tax=Dyadobacter sandarakinus TaxID=2747268 RepID=A0ABX7IDF0_9BACT|nr:GNAT family N-acetyltransferase [Dyadobacter sandarakinus]QRR03945.1 GNAT family N-acetyltransferase [Dyadobacter sandarakinus]
MIDLDKLEISDIISSDRPALKDIYSRVRQETFGWMKLDKLSRDTFDEDTAGEHVMVARYEGMVCGFVSIWRNDNFVHHLYVDSRFQRRGIGAALLRYALKTMKGSATLKCLESNKEAVNFYGKNGWKVKSMGVSYEGHFVLFETVAC